MLTQALVAEEKLQSTDTDLFEVTGMSNELAAKLVDCKILTRDDLAELSVDELVELIEIDRDEGSNLIMEARAHWFDSEGDNLNPVVRRILVSVNTSVKDFAAELKVPVDTLLDQLNLAGVPKKSGLDVFLKKIRKTSPNPRNAHSQTADPARRKK